MTFTGLLLALLVLAGLAKRRFVGLTAQPPAQFANTAPQFDILRHLSGDLLCEGVIYGPIGRLASRFVADMQGTRTGQTARLKEHFRYAGGGSLLREWHITMGENGSFTATADDILGTAQGQQIGAAVRLRYRLRLAPEAGGHVLDVTDWMYMMENGTIMNHSQMRKFGVKVAELIATIRRKDGSDV
jgi:hypothetical protein